MAIENTGKYGQRHLGHSLPHLDLHGLHLVHFFLQLLPLLKQLPPFLLQFPAIFVHTHRFAGEGIEGITLVARKLLHQFLDPLYLLIFLIGAAIKPRFLATPRRPH